MKIDVVIYSTKFELRPQIADKGNHCKLRIIKKWFDVNNQPIDELCGEEIVIEIGTHFNNEQAAIKFQKTTFFKSILKAAITHENKVTKFK